MDRLEFDNLIKEVVSNLYDYVALENISDVHEVFPVPGQSGNARSETIRAEILNAIELIRPSGKSSPTAPEWRPYLILNNRYVEGISLQELSNQLGISPRQLRRDHHRALQVLSAILWKKYGHSETKETQEHVTHESGFDLHLESIELKETLSSVYKMLNGHLLDEGIILHTVMEKPSLIAYTDRVILRQILISLINHAAQLLQDDDLNLSADNPVSGVEIHLEFRVVPDYYVQVDGEVDEALEQVRYWCAQIDAQFEEIPHAESLEFVLSLPAAERKTILVVDDQEPTINMFRRYLSRSNLSIIGVTQPQQVIEKAREYNPVLITLDVMMPLLDGWEVLQALKLNDQTAHIPVLICSAWEEPELSRSLGAIGFLKKPVTQKELLATLSDLGLFA